MTWTRLAGSAEATRRLSRNRDRSSSLSVEREGLLELVDEQKELGVLRNDRVGDVQQPSRSGLQTGEEAGGRTDGHAHEGCVELLERVTARVHVGDEPSLRTGEPAAADRRHQARAHDRGLPATARPDDGDEPWPVVGSREAIEQPLDEGLSSEEVARVGFEERSQSLVGVPDAFADYRGRDRSRAQRGDELDEQRRPMVGALRLLGSAESVVGCLRQAFPNVSRASSANARTSSTIRVAPLPIEKSVRYTLLSSSKSTFEGPRWPCATPRRWAAARAEAICSRIRVARSCGSSLERSMSSLRGSASQEPGHHVGSARLAPVVVDRGDVGMFERGHGLRFGIEPSDECRIVRSVLVHDPDRDLATDVRLCRPIQDAERVLADAFEQPVPAERFPVRIQVRALARTRSWSLRSSGEGSIRARRRGCRVRAGRLRAPRLGGRTDTARASAAPTGAPVAG
jgi:hypothetical protein